MNVVNCQNGHFYDGDKYSVCPHCGASETNGTSLSDSKGKSGHVSTFGGLLSRSRHVGKPQSQTSTSHSEENWQPPHFQTMPSSDETVLLTDDNVSASYEAKNITENGPIAAPTVALQDIVQNASASSSEKTMGYFERMSKTAPSAAAENDTIIPTPAKHNGPVVGWLVCISGNHLGQSFELASGKNTIGRSSENSIVLCNDGGVSGSKHALIVYEPKKREFYLQPGDSSGLTYLNDDFVTELSHINKGDIVELGDTKLMLVPLCSQEFSWEDYLK